jgi:uncharacterized protein
MMSDTPKIFVNLPVTDLMASTAFYEAVGAVRNDQFTDDSAQAMVFSDVIHVMLLTHARFTGFTHRPIPDAREGAQMILCLSQDSRAAVDAIVEKAVAAGGARIDPAEDHGFMYDANFADPDGHLWQIFWMDPAAIPAPQKELAAA